MRWLVSACPGCEPDNPAARYADTCAVHRVEDGLPAHYFDCERFNVTDYGTRQGKCDCTAPSDIQRLLDLLAEFRLRDKAATRVIERLRAASQTSTPVDVVPAASLVESTAPTPAVDNGDPVSNG